MARWHESALVSLKGCAKIESSIRSMILQRAHANIVSHSFKAPNGAAAKVKQEQTNGEAAVPDDRPPWLLDPPLDHDLIHARRIFQKWEKSIKWNTPYPDILRGLQDWLFMELDQLGDVGTDPREGTIEIEAKFGEIKRDGDRYSLPVVNAAIIHPQAYSKFDLHFESNMSVVSHILTIAKRSSKSGRLTEARLITHT